LQTLQLLPYKEYRGVLKEYSIIFYYLPFFGYMYRHRVELCLAECKGGDNVLEIGFGSGLTFLNLNKMYKKIHGLDLTCDIEQVSQVFAPHGIYPDLKNGDILKMPYADNQFDTILLISILEHLKAHELEQAFYEIKRVLKPGGQVVYGAPVELGYNIRDHHFSTEKDISQTAERFLKNVSVKAMRAFPSFFGDVYEIGHFIKS
jgi:ubiquinone/menaquinone biosynthesis C-methylase UbiE